MKKYIDLTITPQVAKLEAEIKGGGGIAPMNRLGILCAKFGQTDKAEQQFKAILAKDNYLPAIVNLGNLYFMKSDWPNALKTYQFAGSIAPDNPRVLLALARVYQALQNYTDAQRNFNKLREIDPKLADQYAYIGQGAGGARAAEADSEWRAVVWESE